MREGSGSPDPDGGTARARAAVAMWTVGKVARSRARSSAGERSPHTREVAGSIPAAPTPNFTASYRRARGSTAEQLRGLAAREQLVTRVGRDDLAPSALRAMKRGRVAAVGEAVSVRVAVAP